MPYTPPGTSPTSRSLTSSRSPSFSSSNAAPVVTPSSGVPSGPITAQSLPRSASFLAKHRRSPAWEKPIDPPTSLQNHHGHHHSKHSNSTESSVKSSSVPRSTGSLHQSPLPKSSGSRIPTGAVISPPDSAQNSSEDEEPVTMRRGRQLDNLKELKDAIRNIPQRRDLSPKPGQKRSKDAKPSDNLTVDPNFANSRSSSESSLVAMDDDSVSDSDIEDDELRLAPPMVRKKSGELVKSSLKSPGGRRRPNSMPSTPTFPKAVHFDQHLEHVRHFRQAEKPLAVSAGSSPVEAFESGDEYPFPSTGRATARNPPYEWEIKLPNFPNDTDERRQQNVCVERIYLSSDNENLVGTISVRNISFQKWVVARFTTDYWKTTSEVVAEFSHDVRRKHPTDESRDHFTFTVKLSEIANLESKILFLCARYNVAGQEFWDNNASMNYKVEFKKNYVPQLGKSGPKPLPRTTGRTNPLSNRPRSVPIFDSDFDAFDGKGSGYDFTTLLPVSSVVGDSPEKQKHSVQKGRSAPDVASRRVHPSSNVFGNRYDFGASLSAAIQAANSALGDRSGLKPKPPAKDKPANPYFAQEEPVRSSSPPTNKVTDTGKPLSAHHRSLSFPVHKSTTPTGTPPVDEAKFRIPKFEGKPSIESSSYRELLETMCFYGSAKGSPSMTSDSHMPQKPQTSPDFAQQLTSSPTNQHLLNVLNIGADSRSISPSPVQRSPLMNVELTNNYSQSSSPPSLVGSQRSSPGGASPVPSAPAYTYGSRYLDGFAIDRSHTPTAIRG